MAINSITENSSGFETENIIEAVDLFCGAGGLTRGLLDAGVKVVAGYDVDVICKHAYEANNRPAEFINKSITDVSADEIRLKFQKNSWKVIVGCAPCQPFSTYTSGKTDSKDHRWSLLSQFTRIIKTSMPDVMSMENVLGLEKHRIFQSFISTLKALGYSVSINKVNCMHYGIPQSRKRLVVLASLHGEITLMPPSHGEATFQTVRDIIGNLPLLEAGQIDESDPLHRCANISTLNLERIKCSVPGGSWRDWPEHLIAKCHRRKSGVSYGSVYGRMKWNEPSPTITTQFYGFGNGRFGHPEQNRALSIREGALIQTFPTNYEFLDPNADLAIGHLGKLIGNAVPVKLGKVIGDSIKAHLMEKHG